MQLQRDKVENGYEVCTLVRLTDFGESTVVYGPNLHEGKAAPPFPIFKEHLKELIVSWDEKVYQERIELAEHADWDGYSSRYFPRLAVVFAVTSDGQKETMGHLDKLGFHGVGPFSKLKHDNSTLTVWTISCDQLCKTLGYVSKYDPRTTEERGY